MPRPLRSAIREGFIAALLLALVVALLDADSTREIVIELLALCVLAGLAIACAPVRPRRSPGSRAPRVGVPRP